MNWGKKQAYTLIEFCKELEKNDIKWFILRSYEGLPDYNRAKDVDIVIEPKKLKKAEEILINSFKKSNFTHLHQDCFDHVHCYNAMDIINREAIHIDLIDGYISKGFEIFKFSELYDNTTDYNGFRVLTPFFDGIMILIYKLFGYRIPKLKESYKNSIYQSLHLDRGRFNDILGNLLGRELAKIVINYIDQKDFDSIINLSSKITIQLRKYVFKKRPFSVLKYGSYFLKQKSMRIIFHYKKYLRSFALMAPDGAGKTTFLNTLINEMNDMYLNNLEDNRFHVYHFRPSIIPNIGAVGEKLNIIEQDTNFQNPHRNKPAGFFSSLFRITYYWIDYVIGWQKCVRNDVHYDRYTVFDRYCFDFIVDPVRTKLGLPLWIRKLYVALIPKPQIVFFLDTDADVIYERKQELTYQEISRQLIEYRKLARTNSRFITLDANQTPEELSRIASDILINRFTKLI